MQRRTSKWENAKYIIIYLVAVKPRHGDYRYNKYEKRVLLNFTGDIELSLKKAEELKSINTKVYVYKVTDAGSTKLSVTWKKQDAT